MKVKEAEKVNIYSQGIIACSACAPMGMEGQEVAEAVNLLSPTGISSEWSISEDETFQGGKKSNPCVCEDDSKRWHWLLQC